jgi:capsular exopolysaccharide synthesis family protein
MSHIFDALQKSIGEDSEIELPSVLLATQLLEATERKTAAARPMGAVFEETVLPKEIAEMLGPSTQVRAAIESSLGADEQISSSTVDQFSQFQTLNVLVPPQSRLVCLTDKESLAAEKFRYLGVRLRQLQQNRLLKKVLITSSIPQEGKSMVAANLACALAQRNRQRTLLMDGDLRRPSVAKLFGLGKIPGITEWLKGDRGPMTSIYHLEEAGLWILPAGDSPRNPLELMQSGKLSGLMEQLTSWFDWIVIDSPPVLPLADTSVWMRLADGILLVTRQGATEKKQLKRGLEAIDQKKLLGALLNSSESTTDNYYYNEYRQIPPVDPSDSSAK